MGLLLLTRLGGTEMKRIYNCLIIALIASGIIYGIVSAGNKTQHVVINDYASCTDLQQMQERAQFIVEGHFMPSTGTWNMARDDFDNSKESQKYYTEGILYPFNVENVLKGDVPDTLTIIQRHTDNYSGKTTVDGYYFDIDCSNKYIVFLYYNEEFDHYYAGFVPWAIRVENEIVYLEGVNKNTMIEDTVTGSSYQDTLNVICP